MNAHELISDGGAEHGRVTIQVSDANGGGEPYELELYPNCALRSGAVGVRCAEEASHRMSQFYPSDEAMRAMPETHEQERLFMPPPMNHSELYSSLRPEPRPLMPAEPKRKASTEINVYRNCQFGPQNSGQYNILPTVNIPLELHIPGVLKAAVLHLWHRLFG